MFVPQLSYMRFILKKLGKTSDFMRTEIRKAVSLFLILFFTWQFLYLITLCFPILSEYWLLAYLTVLVVAVCFFILDKQNAADLGLRKTRVWKEYVAVGFVLAVFYNVYWVVVGASIFSIGPIWRTQHGIFTIPYDLSLALTVSLVEETSFRGYILRNLSKVYSSTKAIVYSSILFGLYHLSLTYAFTSTTSMFETFCYWGLFVLAAILISLFLGLFYMYAEKTTIGTITYHASSIFIESLVPFGLATSIFVGHLLSTTVYAVYIPMLILLKRKRWL